jgi:hypothetical protein
MTVFDIIALISNPIEDGSFRKTVLIKINKAERKMISAMISKTVIL